MEITILDVAVDLPYQKEVGLMLQMDEGRNVYHSGDQTWCMLGVLVNFDGNG